MMIFLYISAQSDNSFISELFCLFDAVSKTKLFHVSWQWFLTELWQQNWIKMFVPLKQRGQPSLQVTFMFWRGQLFIFCFPLFIPSGKGGENISWLLGFCPRFQYHRYCASLFPPIIPKKNHKIGNWSSFLLKSTYCLPKQRLPEPMEGSWLKLSFRSHHCQCNAVSVERALVAVALNLLNDVLDLKSCIFLAFLL